MISYFLKLKVIKRGDFTPPLLIFKSNEKITSLFPQFLRYNKGLG